LFFSYALVAQFFLHFFIFLIFRFAFVSLLPHLPLHCFLSTQAALQCFSFLHFSAFSLCLPFLLRSVLFPYFLGANFANGNRLAPAQNTVHIVPYQTKHLIFSGIIFWTAWPLKIRPVCWPESFSYATTNIRCLSLQKNEGLSSKLFSRIMKFSHQRKKNCQSVQESGNVLSVISSVN
jgi:hypothetical protein